MNLLQILQNNLMTLMHQKFRPTLIFMILMSGEALLVWELLLW